MYQDFKGQTALVTGAGKKSGIGYAIAEKLAQSGANVVLADFLPQSREQNPLLVGGNRKDMTVLAKSLAEQFGINTLFVDVDVTSTASVEKMADVVKTEFGNVHILCNNAGTVLGVPNAVHTYDEEHETPPDQMTDAELQTIREQYQNLRRRSFEALMGGSASGRVVR